jgi:hypothetical protein
MLVNKSIKLIFSFSFLKGDLNSHSSYMIHPRDQTSDFMSYPLPMIYFITIIFTFYRYLLLPYNNSGLIYSGVPTFEYASMVSELKTLPNPKSPTYHIEWS